MVSRLCRLGIFALAISALFACSSVPKKCDDGSGEPWVVLQFDISPDGRVVDPKVLDSCPPGENHEKALTKVRDFTFKPAESGQTGKRIKLRL